MIGMRVIRAQGEPETLTLVLVDHARLERLRGHSLAEKPADVLDMMQLAHIAAVRVGESRDFDTWAADVVDIEAVNERPTRPAETPSAG